MTPRQLTKARLELGKTQAEMGKLLGFTYEHVLRMEKGDRTIQTVTGLAVLWLLFEDKRTL